MATRQHKNETMEFEEWLTRRVGVSTDCYHRLLSYGCNSIELVQACSLSDIEDISQDADIEKIDKLKLKIMIKEMSECDDSKHLIIGMEERQSMNKIDEKIKEFEESIETHGLCVCDERKIYFADWWY